MSQQHLNSELSFPENRPNLYRGLFWDWRYDSIDWHASYRSIIERVLERGTPQEWDEITRFYGRSIIVKALKEEIKYLPDYIIDKVLGYFNLKKEELACYARKLSRPGHWI